MAIKNIIVDGSHVLMTIKQKSGGGHRDAPSLRFEYGRMLDEILGDAELGEHSTLFLSYPPRGKLSYLSEEDEQSFLTRGYKVKRYDLRERRVDCFKCGHHFNRYQEKPVDAAVIVAMFKAALRAEKEESIVLLSGDGDFLEAVDEIVDPLGGYGVPVQVCGFVDTTCQDFMRDPAFQFKSLDEYLKRRSPQRMIVRRRPASAKDWPRIKR